MARSKNIASAAESAARAPVDSLVTDSAEVEEIARAIADAGRFAFDLEFVSEGRYVPDLALVQVAWGSADEPRVALIDSLEVDLRPVLDLIADDGTETIAHAAKQDLGLLAARFRVTARRFWDTQIASAFVGIGEQIGYAKLASHFAGVRLDKRSQYTKWLRRPLSDEQLSYAANDVRYLLLAWRELEGLLEERGRLSWVREESDRMARAAAYLPADEDVYVEVRGWARLEPEALGALRSLAAWRQATARSRNLPLSWVLPDGAMVEICRTRPEELRDLKKVRGVGDGTLRRNGQAILDAVRRGAATPLTPPKRSRKRGLSSRAQAWAGVIHQLVLARCAEAGVAPRFVGTRADAEALAEWFESGDRGRLPDLQLLQGWRRELAGEAALGWLEGRTAVAVASEGDAGLTTVEIDGPQRTGEGG